MARLVEFIGNHWILVLDLAVVVALLVGDTMYRRMLGYKDVGPGEATQLINHQDAIVLDVREQNEFQDGHIVNSIHIPLTALKTKLGELEEFKSRPVIVSCRSGKRSASACSTLHKQGFETVYNMGGGIMAWKNANLPLTKKKK